MNDDQLLRYSRHILLDEIGIEAQERILASRMLVVGAGGLGSPAALYLAAAGVGTLMLADDDTVDLTNLQRQILHRQDRIGMAKTESARLTLASLNPDVQFVPLPRLDTDAALDEAVSGAAIRFDGQLAVFDTRQPTSPCYHCLFPDGENVEEVRCSQMGVFAPLTGIIGTMQASEALKLAGQFGTPSVGRLHLLDGRTLHFTEIRVPRDPDCPVCAHRAHQAR